MSSHVLIIAILIVCLFRCFRLSSNARNKKVVFAASLVVFVLGFSVFALEQVANLIPSTPANRALKSALNDEVDGQATVLIVGSSHTWRGVDPNILEENFQKAGQDYNVTVLARPGMGLLEQDYILDHYLKRAKKMPEYVLFEVAKRYDFSPNKEFVAQRFTDRLTAYSDLRRLIWALRYEFMSNDVRSDVVRSISVHFFRRLFNSFFALEGLKSVRIDPQYSPLSADKENENFSPDEVPRWVDDNRSYKLSDFALPEWLKEFRLYQFNKLYSQGVEMVGFFAPPISNIEFHGYGADFCDEYKDDAICVHTVNKNIIDKLGHKEDWYNMGHLKKQGAEKYSLWLGRQLVNEIQEKKK